VDDNFGEARGENFVISKLMSRENFTRQRIEQWKCLDSSFATLAEQKNNSESYIMKVAPSAPPPLGQNVTPQNSNKNM